MQSLLPTITKELLTALRQARAAGTPAIELFNIYIDQMERQSNGWNLAKNIRNLKYFSKNFRNGAQEDAQEFLNGFLDRLREEFDKLSQFKGPRNPVRAAYAPSYDCRYFCTQCHNSNLKSPQPQEELTFFVEAAQSLRSTLNAALNSLIDGYRCEHCRTESGSARMSGRFTAAPRAFICCVKRFRHGRFGDGGGGKVHREVGFEKKLLLPLAGSKGSAACYELSSIVVHEGGSIHGGHYSCVTRVGDRWFRISDSNVREVSEGHARASSVASSSYIYIYTRTDVGSKRGATDLPNNGFGKRVRLA